MQIALGRNLARFLIMLACWCAAPHSYANQRTPPKQIVSVNLCADQMLIALAPRNKIAALGPFSRDPGLSFFSGRAESFPQVRPRSEALFGIEADAIAVGPFDNAFMRRVIARRNIEEIIVGRWTSIAEVLDGVATFAGAIGEVAAGNELAIEIQRSMKSIHRLVDRTPAPSFLILHRRGFVGEGGLVSELLEVAGFVDAGKGLASSFLSVESVVALRPTLLAVSGRNLNSEDRGLELLEHPALARLYPNDRLITTPDVLTICGGPSTPALISHLRNELNAWMLKQ
jgi:iron complex transport system substrate-binding protein